ncbi:hypothetical protein CsatB_028152 [Cannabis sativa]
MFILLLIIFINYKFNIFVMIMFVMICFFKQIEAKMGLKKIVKNLVGDVPETSGTKKRALPVKADAPKPKRAKISKSARDILILRMKCMLRTKSLNLNRRSMLGPQRRLKDLTYQRKIPLRNGIIFMTRRISSLRKPFRLLLSR